MIDAPAAISRVTNAIIKQSQSILSKKHSRCSFSNSSTSSSPSSSLKSASLILLCVTLLTNDWNQGFSHPFVSSLCSHRQTFKRSKHLSLHKIHRSCTMDAAASINDRIKIWSINSPLRMKFKNRNFFIRSLIFES